MNRDITTDLYNILDLVACGESYGFSHHILYYYFAEIIKPLSIEEIEAFSKTFMTEESIAEGFTEEDAENIKETLIDFKNKYKI